MSEQEFKSNIKKLRSLEVCTSEWVELYAKLRTELFKRGVSPTYWDNILLLDTDVINQPQRL